VSSGHDLDQAALEVAPRSRALFATMIGPHRAHSFLIRALAKYDAAARSEIWPETSGDPGRRRFRDNHQSGGPPTLSPEQ
jgi:hypothetical protein